MPENEGLVLSSLTTLKVWEKKHGRRPFPLGFGASEPPPPLCANGEKPALLFFPLVMVTVTEEKDSQLRLLPFPSSLTRET